MSEEEIMEIIKEKIIECDRHIKNYGKSDCKTSTYHWLVKEKNALQGLLDLYNKEKETSHFLQSELDQTNAKLIEEKEKNEELEQDMKTMFCEEAIINILEIEFDLSRNEAIEILENY